MRAEIAFANAIPVGNPRHCKWHLEAKVQLPAEPGNQGCWLIYAHNGFSPKWFWYCVVMFVERFGNYVGTVFGMGLEGVWASKLQSPGKV